MKGCGSFEPPHTVLILDFSQSRPGVAQSVNAGFLPDIYCFVEVIATLLQMSGELEVGKYLCI